MAFSDNPDYESRLFVIEHKLGLDARDAASECVRIQREIIDRDLHDHKHHAQERGYEVGKFGEIQTTPNVDDLMEEINWLRERHDHKCLMLEAERKISEGLRDQVSLLTSRLEAKIVEVEG